MDSIGGILASTDKKLELVEGLRPGSQLAKLAHQSVVLGVVADPEPKNPAFRVDPESAMVKTDSA